MSRRLSWFEPSASGKRRGALTLCLLATAIWAALVVEGSRQGLWALVSLSIFGAVAFLAGGLVGALPHRARALGHIDAAAAGAMLVAALVLVVPHAVVEHARAGSLGLLIGLGVGLVLHYASTANGGRSILAMLSLHTVCAGVALGALYTLVPTLGWAVGIAILGHKAPAGYVLARRLKSYRGDTILVVLPALGTGLGALSVAIMQPAAALPAGIIFGAAAGLFVVVALAFVASGVIDQRRGAAEWAAFVIGGAAIAVTGLITPHGI